METLKLENGDLQDESKRKENEKQPETARGMLNDFASSTTAHGISRIASASDYRFKVAWLIIWLAVMALFAYLIAELVILYLSKPVSTSFYLRSEQRLTFPSVTVCNLNMIRDSHLKDLRSQLNDIFNQSSGGNDDFVKYSGIASKNISITIDGIENAKNDFIALVNSLSSDARFNMGYKFKDFIKFCTIGGFMCHYGYLKSYWTKTWNWKYGNCYTFNGHSNFNGSKIDVFNVSSSGVTQGMTLTLDIIKSDYVPQITSEEGVRVLIGDQDVSLHPFEEGFSVAPGTLAGIGLKKAIITREDNFNNGSCRVDSAFGDKYTLKHCFLVCKANIQQKSCNCTDTGFANMINSKPCMKIREKICLWKVNLNLSLGILDCSSKCTQQCRSVKYRKTVTHGKLYADGFMESIGTITTFGKNSTKANLNYVEKNIVQLQIYFTDSIVEEVVTQTYYKFDNLVSDIGGQLGLWIGVSAVTIVEFLALVWNLIHYLVNRKNKSQITQDKVKENN